MSVDTFLDPVREAQAVASLKSSIEAVAADDETLLLDMIEGETSFLEVIDKLLERMRDTEASLRGVTSVIQDLQERGVRYEKRIQTDRGLIEQALMLADLPKLERPTATLTLAARQPKVEIQTEAEIPSEFWKAAEPKLDKKALADALKAGRDVPGACLSNAAPSLTIRVK